MSLQLRMDGDAFRDIIGSASTWPHWDQANEFQILKLLESIGVIARDPIPTHIEIIMKRNGRTVLCEYMTKYIIYELRDFAFTTPYSQNFKL
ncbi:hypothetical protein B566_EDAN018424 [Ephemera danica]|nr:hypothetical protein B566_EDAN018424 [Ephemera danica]